MPLGYFELKEINTIRILPDNYFSNKKNILEIKVNNFYKKDMPKGERTFYFSHDEISKIYEILISLNFLRVKSIYDDFTRQFGIIHLPMNHEVKVSHKAKLKIHINLDKSKNNNNCNNNNNNSYSKFLRKSFKGSFISTSSNTFNAKKRNSLNNFELISQSNNEDISKTLSDLKDDIKLLWITGIITLIANVQKRLNEGFIEGVQMDSKLFEVDFVQHKINLLLEADNENR